MRWLALPLLLVAGCAAMHSTARSPASSASDDPRVQIAELEGNIAARRATLGLAPRVRAATVRAGALDDTVAEESRSRAPAMVKAESEAMETPIAPPPKAGSSTARDRGRTSSSEAPAAAPAPRPPPAGTAPAATTLPAEPSPVAADGGWSPVGGAEARPRPAARKPARDPEAAGARDEDRSGSEGVYRRAPRSERCRQTVRAADEICDAAERICHLAHDLHEQAADESCRGARLDCSDARDAAQPCL